MAHLPGISQEQVVRTMDKILSDPENDDFESYEMKQLSSSDKYIVAAYFILLINPDAKTLTPLLLAVDSRAPQDPHAYQQNLVNLTLPDDAFEVEKKMYMEKDLHPPEGIDTLLHLNRKTPLAFIVFALNEETLEEKEMDVLFAHRTFISPSSAWQLITEVATQQLISQTVVRSLN